VQGVANDERRMTIVEHLEELRKVLIISFGAWFAGTIVAFIFNGFVLGLLLRPLKVVLQNSHNIVSTAIFTSPTEGLTVPIKIAAIVGFILALPVILWQTWSFVSPGLRPVERKLVGPFIASALFLFGCGGAFAYFVMPIGLSFLANFLGAIIGIGLIATKRMDRKSHIPFGVFLALGAVMAVFAGSPILHWYRPR